MDSGSSSGPNFNYILNMPLWCLSKEKVDDLLKQRDHKVSLIIDFIHCIYSSKLLTVFSVLLFLMVYLSYYVLRLPTRNTEAHKTTRMKQINEAHL